MPPKIAVIQFPGSNCEYETARAVRSVGLDCDIVRWNISSEQFLSYSGYILPGGFSFQDRIRAGVIASKLPIIDLVIQADQQNKPVLGICNGCQILAEAGLIPNFDESHTIQVALAPNTIQDEPCGFICDWKYVKMAKPEQNIFTKLFSENDVLPIPINHGEGRFVLSGEIEKILNEFMVIRYCDANGEISSNYPVNPNGSFSNIAGLSNRRGNVLAIMPHPERATFLKQVPTWINSIWAEKKLGASQADIQTAGPWKKFFQSLAEHLVNKKQAVVA